MAETPAARDENASHDPLAGQPIVELERDGTRYTLLGTAHVKAGELIPNRLLSPLEIRQQLALTENPAHA